MKIELIKQTLNSDYGYLENCYKYKPIEWCCERIKNNPLIKLGVDEDYYYKFNCPEDCNDDCDVCDMVNNDIEHVPSMTIEYEVTVNSYDDYWTEEHCYRIDYCPFCGEPIEVSIVEEEDISEVYHNIEKEREEMYKMRVKTDSIKKRQELDVIVRKLDEKLNYFHSLEEYKKA